LIGLVLPAALFAQSSSPAPDSLGNGGYYAAISTFYAKLLPDAHIYTGSEFLPYDYLIEGNAFYPDGSTHVGSIDYDGISYGHIPILYDIVKDRVIVLTSNNFLIVPATDKVSRFSMQGRTFVHLLEDTTATGFPGPGIYELVYEGRESLWAKHHKIVKNDPQDGHRFFLESVSYYLKRGTTYYEVNTQRAFLKVLGDRKASLKSLIRKKGLRFKDDRPQTMRTLLTHYDQ
jgi:hypothetical protein